MSGEARVGDEESSDVRWFDVEEPPPLLPRFVRQLALALVGDGPVLFGAGARPRARDAEVLPALRSSSLRSAASDKFSAKISDLNLQSPLEDAMPRTRVHSLNISLDGYAAGEEVTLAQPIGGAERLFQSFDGRFIDGVQHADAPITVDRALTTLWGQGIGAEIMGRRKFGPQEGAWPDDGWRGWWGDEPPFRTPVFVLTHHAHETIDFPNGTSFHFIDASPADALRLAQDAAGGQDVRIGGGPSTVRQFLEADLIDFMHLVIVPIVLGRGTSLWQGLAGVQDRFTVESVGCENGVVHQLWNRKSQV